MSADLVAASQPRQPFSPRQIAAFFFKAWLGEEGELTGYHVCKAWGKRRKHKPRSGYTNLVSHVRAAHPAFESEMRDATAAATGTLVPWVSQKTSNRYSWMNNGTKHYLAVYAYYDGPNGPRYPLLSIVPVMEEANDKIKPKRY
ncbi:Hypothetical protein PHPALM_20171 [Phytophthora palmivora]|uniref:BED-type domain-containing protein n=1 Tax=Phytophthora palmivora TaxID=4796 RepID=A0A2P4XFJ3_9STRA|nr:Hypothetical protein PHPALM_20171 [Phytophthora palmivora]